MDAASIGIPRPVGELPFLAFPANIEFHIG